MASFVVSPNPAYGEAEVRFGLHVPAPVTVEAYTADGRQVYAYRALYSAGEQRHTLSLPAGLYRVVLSTGTVRLSQSLVVVR
ncbi:MAG: hypothetical protein KatS3mg026_1627 [Bacteroidia bacterium]|nr:MAG: hypothetical protein KatS3mg026_1627 [Bacteroidia bacterium]